MGWWKCDLSPPSSPSSHSPGSLSPRGWQSLVPKHKRDPSPDLGQTGLYLGSITGIFSLLRATRNEPDAVATVAPRISHPWTSPCQDGQDPAGAPGGCSCALGEWDGRGKLCPRPGQDQQPKCCARRQLLNPPGMAILHRC